MEQRIVAYEGVASYPGMEPGGSITPNRLQHRPEKTVAQRMMLHGKTLMGIKCFNKLNYGANDENKRLCRRGWRPAERQLHDLQELGVGVLVAGSRCHALRPPAALLRALHERHCGRPRS